MSCQVITFHNSGPFSDFSALLPRAISSDIAFRSRLEKCEKWTRTYFMNLPDRTLAPKARPHTSLGQRPRFKPKQPVRAVSPAHRNHLIQQGGVGLTALGRLWTGNPARWAGLVCPAPLALQRLTQLAPLLIAPLFPDSPPRAFLRRKFLISENEDCKCDNGLWRGR